MSIESIDTWVVVPRCLCYKEKTNMKTKILIPVGIILLVAISAGCQDKTINASNSLSKTEVNVEEDSVGTAEEDPDTNCSAVNPHPVAEGMAETFEITYDEVMTLYCDGYAFSDILLALETSELVDETPTALLARLRTRSWQEIWDEYAISPVQ